MSEYTDANLVSDLRVAEAPARSVRLPTVSLLDAAFVAAFVAFLVDRNVVAAVVFCAVLVAKVAMPKPAKAKSDKALIRRIAALERSFKKTAAHADLVAIAERVNVLSSDSMEMKSKVVQMSNVEGLRKAVPR